MNPLLEHKDELAEFGRDIVLATLQEMGLKPSKIQNGRIYRSEMVEVIGRKSFDKAIKEGRLLVQKGESRNSKVYARRVDWQRFLSKMNSL